MGNQVIGIAIRMLACKDFASWTWCLGQFTFGEGNYGGLQLAILWHTEYAMASSEASRLDQELLE